jgi:hypothetical protein
MDSLPIVKRYQHKSTTFIEIGVFVAYIFAVIGNYRDIQLGGLFNIEGLISAGLIILFIVTWLLLMVHLSDVKSDRDLLLKELSRVEAERDHLKRQLTQK